VLCVLCVLCDVLVTAASIARTGRSVILKLDAGIQWVKTATLPCPLSVVTNRCTCSSPQGQRALALAPAVATIRQMHELGILHCDLKSLQVTPATAIPVSVV
jgi:hypothetical protein